jgi:hypothetical protein
VHGVILKRAAHQAAYHQGLCISHHGAGGYPYLGSGGHLPWSVRSSLIGVLGPGIFTTFQETWKRKSADLELAPVKR